MRHPASWWSDGEYLHLDAFDPLGEVLFYRVEESLATSTRYELEANVSVSRYLLPPDNPTVGIGISDGTRLAKAEAGPDIASGMLEIEGRIEPFVISGIDWSEPVTVRFVIDKTESDPAAHTAELYINGTLRLAVPYEMLPATDPSVPPLIFAIGGRGTNSVWDFARYAVCQPPEERPPLAQQVAALKEEVEALDMPPVFRVFFSRRLDQALAEPDRLAQGQAFYRIGRELFVLKRVGLLREGAVAFETLLDFARVTAAPEVGREDGYFGRLEIASVLPKSSEVVPGEQPAAIRVFATVRPALLHGWNPDRYAYGLMARSGIVDIGTGEMLESHGEFYELPANLHPGQRYQPEPMDFEWAGNQQDGTLVRQGEQFFVDTTVGYVIMDRFTGQIAGHLDQSSSFGEIGSTLQSGLYHEVFRHYAGRATPTTDMVLGEALDGRYFIHTDALIPAAPGASCDPVMHVLNPQTGSQLAGNDDCVTGMETCVRIGGACFPAASVSCRIGSVAVACPSVAGTRNACLMQSFSNQAPRIVLHAYGNSSRGRGLLKVWKKIEDAQRRRVTYQLASVPVDVDIGGERLWFSRGWYSGDELDLIVPSPERARMIAGLPPAHSPTVFLLGTELTGMDAFARDNGMGGGARVSSLPRRSQAMAVVASGVADGAVALYVNDVRNAPYSDGDGLGAELEGDIGTDPDNRDTDGDGLWDGFEVLGIRGAGLYPDQALPTWGADPRHKDVFLESDHYNAPSLDHPGRPLSAAGALLMAEYAGKCSGGPGYLNNPDGRRGFSIHVDNGVNPVDASGNITSTAHGAWGGTSGVPSSDCAQFEYGWRFHMSPIRHGIFRYGVGCPDGTGTGSVGHPYFYFNSDDGGQPYFEKRPGVYAIHELGHNFGLEHYGKREDGSSFNFKPHYISLMNYAYEWGSPNPRATDDHYKAWDPLNLRFSEGERRYELDVQGNRTGREYALDPAALDEGVLWSDVPSWGSTTGYDLSHGLSGWQSYPWYRIQYVPDSARYPWLAIDWDRDGEVHLSPGAWTKADVLIWESATFKRWDFRTPLRSGPYLADGGSKVLVFFVKENRNRISYRAYSEPADCDPENIGPVGQEGLPGSGEPPCGDWSGEREIGVDLSIDGDLSIVRDPNFGSQLIFYRDTQDRLCLLEFSEPNWWGPVCAPSDIRSAPEAIVYGERILVFGLGETDPYSKVGPVLVVEIPATSPHDTTSWVNWPLTMLLDGNGTWRPLTSRTPPALVVDPGDGSLLGAITDGEHVIHLFTNPWGGWIYFNQLPENGYWHDKPKVSEQLDVYREPRKTDRRPSLFIERLPNGLPRWTMWIHGDVEDNAPPERAFNGYYRFVSTIVSDPAGPKPAFSMISDGSPDGVNPVHATNAMNVSLAKYRGKLRAAIGYDVGQGDSPGKGFIFLPLADGVFHAALKDVNDVEIIGQRMANTLGPLFLGMSIEEMIRIFDENHMLRLFAATSMKACEDPAFDGIKDADLRDLHCFPMLDAGR